MTHNFELLDFSEQEKSPTFGRFAKKISNIYGFQLKKGALNVPWWGLRRRDEVLECSIERDVLFGQFKDALSAIEQPFQKISADNEEFKKLLVGIDLDMSLAVKKILSDNIDDSDLRKGMVCIAKAFSKIFKYMTSSYMVLKSSIEVEKLFHTCEIIASDYRPIDSTDYIAILKSEISQLSENKHQILAGIENDVRAKAQKILDDFLNELTNIKQNYIVTVQEDITNHKQRSNECSNELTDLFGDIKSYKSLISEKTQDEIAKHYQNKAKSEMRMYWIATTISLLIIGGSIWLAWSGLSSYYNDYVDIKSVKEQFKGLSRPEILKLEHIRDITQKNAFIYTILRLVISFFLFLTVLYTSRIAYRSYSHWRHSENMQLKLSSLRPFINRLDSEDQKQIHKDLIPDYFGKEAGIVETNSDKFKDLPENVSKLAITAIERIGGGNEKKKVDSESKSE